MKSSCEWMKKYEEAKRILVSPVHYARLFESHERNGVKLHIINMGKATFPSGDVLVRDPLAWLNENEEPYLQRVPTGVFDIETLVAEVEDGHYRYVASRIKFNEKTVTEYREALKGDECLDDVDENSFFGFYVDAGLATIVDVKTRDAYCQFREKWYAQNPEGEIYNDFFALKFKENAEKNPKYQRADGDWINFEIPNSNLSIPMIQSGWGDGIYPVYFGYDENDNVCEIVVEYIFVGND